MSSLKLLKKQKARELCCTCTALKELFQLTTISLLALLLPLSFLLLARLSCARFPFDLSNSQLLLSKQIYHTLYLFTFTYYTNLSIYVLVTIITLATLIQCLTGKITLLSEATSPAFKPRLFIAWSVLCALQLCVGVAIEESIYAGVNKITFGTKTSMLSRLMFFLGMHETMLYWSTGIVKPVADETIFGVARDERLIERVAVSISFGSVWCWRLRDELEAMVVVGDIKTQLSMALETADLLNWWLYYLTATIGTVRVVKSAVWVASVFLCRSDHIMNHSEDSEADDKV